MRDARCSFVGMLFWMACALAVVECILVCPQCLILGGDVIVVAPSERQVAPF